MLRRGGPRRRCASQVGDFACEEFFLGLEGADAVGEAGVQGFVFWGVVALVAGGLVAALLMWRRSRAGRAVFLQRSPVQVA